MTRSSHAFAVQLRAVCSNSSTNTAGVREVAREHMFILRCTVSQWLRTSQSVSCVHAARACWATVGRHTSSAAEYSLDSNITELIINLMQPATGSRTQYCSLSRVSPRKRTLPRRIRSVQLPVDIYWNGGHVPTQNQSSAIYVHYVVLHPARARPRGTRALARARAAEYESLTTRARARAARRVHACSNTCTRYIMTSRWRSPWEDESLKSLAADCGSSSVITAL